MEMGIGVSQTGLQFTSEFQNVVVCSDGREKMGGWRRRMLKKMDFELVNGNRKRAFSIVKQLQGKPNGLRGFGAANQVHQRCYTLEEIKPNGLDLLSLQQTLDKIMDTTERTLQFCALENVSFDEGYWNLKLEKTYVFPCEDYHNMCLQHEAGHFLIAYLIGVFPVGYTIPSVEAMREDELLGGRVDYVGFEFLNSICSTTSLKKKTKKESARLNREKIPSKDLNRFSCVSLAGLVAEHLAFGCSEGSFTDIEMLGEIFEWLEFTKTEADFQMKWAALNTLLILRRHENARSKLAEAMSEGRSVGFCINMIEKALDSEELL